MANLIIDEGNTNVKLSIFSHGKETARISIPEMTSDTLEQIIRQHGIKRSIYSTVRHENEAAIATLERHTDFTLFDHTTPLPIENLYATPSTLGRDRLAACVGANYLEPNKNLLVIDIGTAITYDVVNERNQYLGGNISPGMQMRLNALHHFTAKLPLVDINTPYKPIGDDTQSAIYAGCRNGILYEIEGYKEQFSLKFPNLSVFLTGGGAFYFERQLKFSIFAVTNLIQIGLNRILNYQC